MLLIQVADAAEEGLFVSKHFQQMSVCSALKFSKSLFSEENKC